MGAKKYDAHDGSTSRDQRRARLVRFGIGGVVDQYVDAASATHA